MKSKALIVLLLASAALATRTAKAQLGIYGGYQTTHDPSTATWYQGFDGGAYLTFLHAGPIHIGADIRGAYGSGHSYGYRDFLLGPRLEVKPPFLPIRPYVQAELGVGGTEYNGASALTTHYNNKFQYGVLGGLDYTLLPLLEIRVAEVGYLKMSGVSAPALNLVTVGAGVVFHIP